MGNSRWGWVTAKHVLSGMILASSSLWLMLGYFTRHWLPLAFGFTGVIMAVALFKALRDAEAQ